MTPNTANSLRTQGVHMIEAQKISIKSNGSAEKLIYENFQMDTDLAADEVLIDVHFSGINFADIVMRLGFYQDAPPKPFVPGYELSGVVSAVGDDVQDLKPGDKVMAGTRFGGYVSNIKLPRKFVIKLDDDFDLQQAAALPVNYITAHIALNDFGRMRQGDKILLDCATGGVGVVAMQMAKAVGATVVGLTTSPHKKEFIESFGAKAYTHDEFKNSSEKDFDFILNSSGGASLKDQYDRLSKGGKLCCIGMQDAINDGKSNIFKFLKTVVSTPRFSMVKNIMQSKMVGGFNALKFFEDDVWLEKNLQSLSDIPFKAHIGGVFAAEEAPKAHMLLEQKKARGKVLLEWKH
jgi:2-desacetyl-2-hydroxyethyl bacteriochlorophyllide A dehydrogenase